MGESIDPRGGQDENSVDKRIKYLLVGFRPLDALIAVCLAVCLMLSAAAHIDATPVNQKDVDTLVRELNELRQRARANRDEIQSIQGSRSQEQQIITQLENLTRLTEQMNILENSPTSTTTLHSNMDSVNLRFETLERGVSQQFDTIEALIRQLIDEQSKAKE